MVRKLIRASMFAALGLVAMTLAYGAAATAGEEKKDDKVPTIKEIMAQGHKGTKSFLGKIGSAVKAEKWDDATTPAKALALFGEALGKNKPSKGEDASWKELTDKYAANTKAVLAAVEKKDADAANTALKAISDSCAGCHKAHK